MTIAGLRRPFASLSATPPALVRATAERIPGARFVEIAQAGHLPCVEQPDRVAALLQAHLA